MALGWIICRQAGLLTVGMTIFGIQWTVFFAHALPRKSEKFFDLTGSITYILCSVVSLGHVLLLAKRSAWNARNVVNALLVVIWASRLGTFLFRRIQKDTQDSRFAKIRGNAWRFFGAWNIQALWVILTAFPVFSLNSLRVLDGYGESGVPAISLLDFLGWSIWSIGFAIEVSADRQKSIFRQQPENAGKFIDQGLWSISRHPNYVGEIILWFGIFLSCSRAFSFWKAISASISPVFVFFLLRYVSGVPLLERKADKCWGNDPAYQKYKAQTPVLFPVPVSWMKSKSH